MERIMLVMIVVVALVAVGGLLYVGVQKAPSMIPPVILQQAPVMAQPAQDAVASTTGTFKFSVSEPTDVVASTGTFKFEVK